MALAAFKGESEPKDLHKIFSIPANSNTDLAEPPAITPVPSAAGFNNTFPAPAFALIGCGIDFLKIGTTTRFFLASITAFWIAPITSLDLPHPIPTLPLPSPTTTTALKLNFFPPFTTFVTLLI